MGPDVNLTFKNIFKFNLCSQLNTLLCCCCCCCYYYHFRGNIRLWKRTKWEISIVLFLQREQCWERRRWCEPTFSIKSGALPIVCYWKIARTSPIRSSCHGNWKISLGIFEFVEFQMKIHNDEQNRRFLWFFANVLDLPFNARK